MAALTAVPLPAVMVHPPQVRDSANSTGQLAKTNCPDPLMPAHFGAAALPPRSPPGRIASPVLSLKLGIVVPLPALLGVDTLS